MTDVVEVYMCVSVWLDRREKDSLETKNMIPAAKERLNLSKEEKWEKDMIPAMMPAKQDIPDRIMKALVAFQYAGRKQVKSPKSSVSEKS